MRRSAAACWHRRLALCALERLPRRAALPMLRRINCAIPPRSPARSQPLRDREFDRLEQVLGVCWRSGLAVLPVRLAARCSLDFAPRSCRLVLTCKALKSSRSFPAASSRALPRSECVSRTLIARKGLRLESPQGSPCVTSFSSPAFMRRALHHGLTPGAFFRRPLLQVVFCVRYIGAVLRHEFRQPTGGRRFCLVPQRTIVALSAAFSNRIVNRPHGFKSGSTSSLISSRPDSTATRHLDPTVIGAEVGDDVQ